MGTQVTVANNLSGLVNFVLSVLSQAPLHWRSSSKTELSQSAGGESVERVSTGEVERESQLELERRRESLN